MFAFSGTIPVIPLAFFFLAALLLWFVIESNGSWIVKLALIFFVPILTVGMWGALASYQGWATPEQIPEKALLLGAKVDEPDSSSGDPGAIYLLLGPYPESASKKAVAPWLVPLDMVGNAYKALDYQARPGEPRLYKMPYTQQLRDNVEKAMQSDKQMIIERNPKKRTATGGIDTPDGLGDQSSAAESQPQFYELPPPYVPPKDS